MRVGFAVRGRLDRYRLRLAVVLPLDDPLAVIVLLVESVLVGIDAAVAGRVARSAVTVTIRFAVFRAGRRARWTAIDPGRFGPVIVTARSDDR
jgi:hypothetical protein